MKFFTATFFTALLLSLSTGLAQDASVVPIPDKVPSEPQPLPLAQPSPTPFSLMPDNMPPPVEKPSRRGSADRSTDRPSDTSRPGIPGPVVKKNKTDDSIDNIADRIKFREAKTKALRDEKVIDLDAQIAAAKTDPEKRALLKDYYTLLYAKILKIDGSLKKLVADRLKKSLDTLDQSKVRPKGHDEALVSH